MSSYCYRDASEQHHRQYIVDMGKVNNISGMTVDCESIGYMILCTINYTMPKVNLIMLMCNSMLLCTVQ